MREKRNPRSLVLAAHGSRCGGAAEALEAIATRLHWRGRFDQVLTAYNQGEPTFEQVPDLISADAAVVVPVFLADGYYSKQVLPRKLQQAKSSSLIDIWLAPVVGSDSRLCLALLTRMGRLIQRLRWDPRRTTVVVLGHGTPRSSSSTLTTREAADFLSKKGPCSIVHSAFLDDSPSPQEVLEGLETDYCMVLPFLFGRGGHSRDLAQLLGLEDRWHSGSSAIAGRDGQGLKYFIDRPLGEDPVMVEIINDLAWSHHAWVRLDQWKGDGHGN